MWIIDAGIDSLPSASAAPTTAVTGEGLASRERSVCADGSIDADLDIVWPDPESVSPEVDGVSVDEFPGLAS